MSPKWNHFLSILVRSFCRVRCVSVCHRRREYTIVVGWWRRRSAWHLRNGKNGCLMNSFIWAFHEETLTEHSQIRYSDGATLEFVWLQFTITCFSCQFFNGFVDVNQTFAIGLRHDGRNQTFVCGHGNGALNWIVPTDERKKEILLQHFRSISGGVLTTYILMKLPCHDELASGTFFDANAVALITKSLNDNFTPSFSRFLLNLARSAVSLSTLISTVR